MLDIDLAIRADDLISVGIDPFKQRGVTLSEVFKVAVVNNRSNLRGRFWAYITDLPQNPADISDAVAEQLKAIINASAYMLCQTRQFEAHLLGNFPASIDVSPDGLYAISANFNLHGDMVPSSQSVIYTPTRTEVSRVITCTMPHGSRIDPSGKFQYSACMMDDLAVEVDTRTFAVARTFRVAKGAEQGYTGLPTVAASHTGHLAPRTAHRAPSCSPTWVQPSADGSKVYVACNKSNEVVELDVQSWAVTRRLPAGDGVYNLAVTHDGKLLLATNKRGQSVSVFDLASGKEAGRIATTRKIVHGVVVSPDDRYAFVSVEGIGAEPGTLEVVDLRTRARAAAVDVGQMAGGIDFWKMEGAAR